MDLLALEVPFPEKYGIGVVLTRANPEAPIIIRECFEGGPADCAGVRAGDDLVEIDGRNIRATAWTQREVVEYLLRDAAEPVTVKVNRAGEYISVSLMRARMSDIVAREDIKFAPTSDPREFLLVPLDSTKTFRVGELVAAHGLRDQRCAEVELKLSGAEQTILYFWSQTCGPSRYVNKRLAEMGESANPGRTRLVSVNIDGTCEAFQTALDSIGPVGERYWAGRWGGSLGKGIDLPRRGTPLGALLDREGRLVRTVGGADSVLALVRGVDGVE